MTIIFYINFQPNLNSGNITWLNESNYVYLTQKILEKPTDFIMSLYPLLSLKAGSWAFTEATDYQKKPKKNSLHKRLLHCFILLPLYYI